ncbi:hypothetical protein D9758_014948 [Tetrapyrgos nigripes]|uniref:DUF6535 domain-containing protein n=1 Tax=Tetrapyrgos nigripes TaxID=182062 RepID=A0A8H5CKE1_9AGAR|nr:hypothetical protein D9758_014948 [Tetrapyrgos nigripes]
MTWNTGTCLYMVWTGLACLNLGINSVVWNNDAINRAPVWCDISTRFFLGASVAIPAASLCINRRLYHISTANSVTTTRAEKRRAIMVDLAIGLGIPILEMILQYIAQGHRFNIFQEIGCYPFTYNTWVAYVLVSTWPIAIGLVSISYCIRSIIAFNKRRTQFKQLLSKNSNLSSNRYWRLMCLAATEVLFTIPLGAYAIYLNTTSFPIQPWISFADTHFGFSRVDNIPSLIWRSDKRLETPLEITRWSPVICAIIFFGYFGFADEARKNYKAFYGTVTKKLGISTAGSESKLGSIGSRSFGFSSSGNSSRMPVIVTKETSRKRDSLDSFTNFSTSDGGDRMSYNEKSFNGEISFGGLSLNDVGGALADTKECSSPISESGSSIIESPKDIDAPGLPKPAPAVMKDELTIEVSSIRHPSMVSIPSPSLAVGSVPKHPIDAPFDPGFWKGYPVPAVALHSRQVEKDMRKRTKQFLAWTSFVSPLFPMPPSSGYDPIPRNENLKDADILYSPDEIRSGEDEDSCSKLWSVYVDEAHRYDQDLLLGWKSDMEGMLLFSALYSASLTAFIIESYKTLQVDQINQTVQILFHISQQLSNNTSLSFESPSFQPAPAALICNTLWFLSLSLALTCSLLATFVVQWTRDFIHKTTMRPSPVRQARILAFTYFGLREFGMHTFVDVIPILLHLSLLLFFTGLVAFLTQVNKTLTALMTVILIVSLAFYIILTLLPIFHLHSPYRTPFSNFIWHWGNSLSGWLLHKHGLKTDRSMNLTEAVLEKSFLNPAKRDIEAIEFTMRSLTDDTELLPLIEAIPDLIWGPNGVRSANVPLITPLLKLPSSQMNVVSRITSFIGKSGAWTDPAFRARSITTCPKALWSVAFMLLRHSHLLVPTEANNFQSIWLDQDVVRSLTTSTFLHQEYSISALAAVRLVREYRCVLVTSQVLDSPSNDVHHLQKQLQVALEMWKDMDLTSGGYAARMVQLFASLLTRLLSLHDTDNRVRSVHTSLELCARTAHSELKARLKTKRVSILSEFLTNAMTLKAYPYQFSLMCQTIFPNIFDHHPLIIEIDDVQAFSAYRPFQRIETIIASGDMNAITDDLFSYSLQLFFLTPQACSDLPGPAGYREVIQRYIIARDQQDRLALKRIWRKDLTCCLEACILQDIQQGAEHPDVAISAAWHLCQSLHDTSSSRIPNRLREFGTQLFRALRNAPGASNPRPHLLTSLLRMFADWVVLDSLVYSLRQRAMKKSLVEGPLGNVMEDLRTLGQELLPDFVLPESSPLTHDKEWVEDFWSYLMSLNLTLVARYIQTVIRNPGDDNQDSEYLIQALRRMTRNFLAYQGIIADESQINFVECVLDLISSHTKKPTSSSTCVEILKAVFMMSRDWRWIRNRRCAKHLSEAIQKHKNSDSFKSFGWEEELLARCRVIAQPVVVSEFVNEGQNHGRGRHRHGRSFSRPTNDLDLMPVELSTPWAIQGGNGGEEVQDYGIVSDNLDSPIDPSIPRICITEPDGPLVLGQMTPVDPAMPWSEEDGDEKHDSDVGAASDGDESRRWTLPLISESQATGTL